MEDLTFTRHSGGKRDKEKMLVTYLIYLFHLMAELGMEEIVKNQTFFRDTKGRKLWRAITLKRHGTYVPVVEVHIFGLSVRIFTFCWNLLLLSYVLGKLKKFFLFDFLVLFQLVYIHPITYLYAFKGISVAFIFIFFSNQTLIYKFDG